MDCKKNSNCKLIYLGKKLFLVLLLNFYFNEKFFYFEVKYKEICLNVKEYL